MMEYIRSDSFAATTESKCDASKICLAGASAGNTTSHESRTRLFLTVSIGGWLAMLLGFDIGIASCGLRIPQPSPIAIAVFYPITDICSRSDHLLEVLKTTTILTAPICTAFGIPSSVRCPTFRCSLRKAKLRHTSIGLHQRRRAP